MARWQEDLHILLAIMFTHSSLLTSLSSLLLNALKPCHPLGPDTSALLPHTLHLMFLTGQAIPLFHLVISATPHFFPFSLSAIPSHSSFHQHHRHLDDSTQSLDSLGVVLCPHFLSHCYLYQLIFLSTFTVFISCNS